MKRLSIMASAGLLAAAMAGPSFAADLPQPAYKAPVYVAPAFSWTGFYVGINGGYGWGDGEVSTAAGTRTTDIDGWLVGGTVGYNLQTGVWVWGLEGDIAYAMIDGTNSSTAAICAGCEIENTFFATARGRIGYSFGRFLPYFTGGAAFATLDINAPSGASESNTSVGWTIGGGLEYAFMGPWSAKIEYLYADFGDETCSVATCGVATTYNAQVNIVRAGINYRF